MAFKIIITLGAGEDLLNTWLFYEDIQQGLGDRFQTSVNSRMYDLSMHPEHYGYLSFDKRKIYRSVMVKRFPFQIIFEVKGDEVIIFGIIHAKRHPAIIFKRLPG